MARLDGKVALVTGSSRGIGEAIVKLFAQCGAAVVVHGRDEQAVQRVYGEVTQVGGRGMGVTADVTRFNEIERMRQKIEAELGPVEVLVANAGGSLVRPGAIEEIPEDGWRATVDENLTATFLTVKSFLPGMKERKKGNIITMSSMSGRKAHERSPAPYAAAKAGIQIFTQILAAQAGPFGIRANCIAPETILTERNKKQIPEAMQKEMVNWHPVRRLGTPEDVAQAALYLASDESAWITGVTLDVTGGAFMP